MRVEPSEKRAVVFVDGQNLFHAARDAFGCTFPDYDISALAKALTAWQGWTLVGVRFYTGIPDAADNAHWHHFWTAKLAAMGRHGVVVFSRPLRYRNRTVRLPDGTSHAVLTGEEKGIDVRIALDVIASAQTAPSGFPSTARCTTGASIAGTTGRAVANATDLPKEADCRRSARAAYPSPIPFSSSRNRG